MSDNPINQASYNDLFGYSILIYKNASWPDPGTLYLGSEVNGFWGSDSDASIQGNIYPSSASTTNYTDAKHDFAGLYNKILDYAISPPTNLGSGYNDYITGTIPSGSNITLNPTTIYSSSGLDLEDVTVNFQLTSDISNDQFFIIVDGDMSFTNVTFNLIGDAGDADAVNIYWLITGTTYLKTTPKLYGTFLYRGSESQFYTDATTINGNIYTDNGNTLNFNTEATTITMIGQTTTCFLEGSKILTEFGYKAIEDLKVGDKIITKGEINNDDYIDKKSDYNSEPIIWLGSFTPIKKNLNSYPICIKKNALGENLPFEDLFVSPLHRIILYGKMIPAENLVNGDTIFQDTSKKSIVYYHLELPSHYSIIANGILTETYKDFGNKHVFDKNKIPLNNEIIQPLEILA
jgi:hypothetical protein